MGGSCTKGTKVMENNIMQLQKKITNTFSGNQQNEKEKILVEKQKLQVKERVEKKMAHKQQKAAQKKLQKEEEDELFDAIENGETQAVIDFVLNKEIKPTDDIGSDGSNWTVIHFACKYDSPNILANLLYNIFQQSGSEEVQKVLATETIQGYTAAEVCVIFDTSSALTVLLQIGGLNLKKQNQTTQKTIRQTANKFKSKASLEVLAEYPDDEDLPVSEEYFSEPPSLQNDGFTPEQEEQREALAKMDEANLIEIDYEELQGQDEYEAEDEELQQKYNQEQEKLQKEREEEEKRRKEQEQKFQQEQPIQKDGGGGGMEDVMKQQNQERQRRNQEKEQERLQMEAQMDEKQREALEQIQKEKLELLKKQYENRNPKVLQNSLYRQVVAQMEKENGVFKDPEFPHTCQSITGSEQWPTDPAMETTPWMRPHQIFKCDYTKINLFEADIEPNDIQQGGLGTCYFLAVLSALAEHPERIRKIFLNEGVANKYGVYSVLFYLEGKQKEVLVDDFIPSDENSELPLFTQSVGNELWTILLEKAWAKCCTYYLRAEGDSATYAVQELTGCPTDSISMEEWVGQKDQLFARFKDYDAQNYMLGCSTCGSKADAEKTGIVKDHQYTLIGVYQIGKVKLLKIRNPWGSGEWLGKYGDDGQAWTEELKKAVKFQKKIDGIFYVDLQEFFQAFSDADVGYYRDNFEFFSIPIVLPHQQDKLVYFEISEKTEVNIRLHQKYGKRIFEEGYGYQAGTKFSLLKENPDGTFQIVCNGNPDYQQSPNLIQKEHDTVFHVLEAGKYHVLINWDNFKEGKDPKYSEFYVSTYADKIVHLIEQKVVTFDQYNEPFIQDFANTIKKEQTEEQGILLGMDWGFNNKMYFFSFENQSGQDRIARVNSCGTKGYMLFQNKTDTIDVTIPAQGTAFTYTQESSTPGEFSYTIEYL